MIMDNSCTLAYGGRKKKPHSTLENTMWFGFEMERFTNHHVEGVLDLRIIHDPYYFLH